MDRVSERERSSRKPRDHRDSGKDRDRDRDGGDHKHRHRHGDDNGAEKRHRSKDDKHRDRRSRDPEPKLDPSSDTFGDPIDRSDDENHQNGDRRQRSRPDSLQDLDREHSVEHHGDEKHRRAERRHRLRADSPQDLDDRSSARVRDSGKHSKDGKHRDGEQRRHGRSSDRVNDSVERDGDSRELSVERHHISSGKRKDHDGSEDDFDKRGKRARVSSEVREERKERRRFGDQAVDDARDVRGEERTEEKLSKDRKRKEKPSDVEEDREKSMVKKEDKEKRRKFSDDTKEEEKGEEHVFSNKVKKDDLVSVLEERPLGMLGNLSNGEASNVLEKSNSIANVVPREPHALTSNAPMISASASHHPIPTKVPSITTANENEGVSVIRSDEVPRNSSTDGTTAPSVAAKGGSLSLDALAKAKKALQIQKDLSEKLKKITSLNKLAPTSTVSNDGTKVTPKSFVETATTEEQSAAGVIPGLATGTSLEAVKRAQELAAKMGFRQDPEFAPLINMFPGPSTTDAVLPLRGTKAPVLRLDPQGREIDEHGNIINIPKLTNLSTLKVNINKQKKEAFQILRPDLDADVGLNPHFDARMGVDKTKLLRPKRMTFQFVEEGKWSKQAEIIKFKNQFGEAQAKELKTKQSQFAKAKCEVDNPNLIELPERVARFFREKKKDAVPEIEWWDKPIIASAGYGEFTVITEKITMYVEHPRPIDPPAEPAAPPPQPLKLTKKEQKKLRTQRRLAKEKDRQEMIRQGLVEPPKAKIKMTNLMKVLGSEATQDPTRLEMEIRSAAAEREQAHVDRNIARKLTPAERREKKERKLFEDPTTLETVVSVYKVKDLSHPQTRFKVDVNAQENRLTGVAVMSDDVTVVVVEGGKKPIKRYGKLMLNRINWAAAVGADDGCVGVNSCDLVWQGSVAKPSFHKFMVHQCRTEAAAKKVFLDAGVPHYWDLALNFTKDL